MLLLLSSDDLRANTADPGKPQKVTGFGWNFNGCSHIGGGLCFTPGPAEAVIHATA